MSGLARMPKRPRSWQYRGMTTGNDGTGTSPTGGLLAPFGLIRVHDGRQIAGVCAGLGNASGTDAKLWRAGMAVMVLFAGAGLLLYLVGWLFMPNEGDEVSPLGALFRRGRSGTAVVATVGLLLTAVVLAVVVLTNPGVYPVVCVGAAAMLVSALAANRPPPEPATDAGKPDRRGDAEYRAPFAPQGPYTRTRELPAAAREPATTETIELPQADDTVPDGYLDASSCDTVELPGVPERPQDSPSAAVSQNKRSVSGRINLIGFGLVGLAVGVMLVIVLAGVPVPLMVFEGVAVLIIGLVLIAGARWGRPRALSAAGLMLSLVVCAHYLVFDRHPEGAFNTSMVVTTVDDVPSAWSVQASSAELDLTRVPFEDGVSASVTVNVEAGNGRITVPRDVDLYLTADVTGGDARLVEESGPSAVGLRAVGEWTSYGGDGPGGGELWIDLWVEFGNVAVVRE